MAVTQVSDLNSLFNTIYERALFVAREANLMTGLVDNRSATGWMTRVIPIRPQISAVTVAETQDFNSPTTFGRSTQATITPGEIAAQVVLTDRDLETDPESARADAEFELGMAIAAKIDTDLISLFSSFSSDLGDGGGAAATFENFAGGVAVVRATTLNQGGAINAVLHPYQWHDLWLEIGRPSSGTAWGSDYVNQAMRDYFMTSLLGGVRVYTSANITAGTASVGGIFTPTALMLDTRRGMRFEPERDASARAWELNVNAGYGYGVVRSTYGVAFTTDASTPA